MSVDWEPKLAEVDEALASATPVDEQIGRKVRLELYSAGYGYSMWVPEDAPSYLIESTEHIAWRAAMTQAAIDLDEIARLADGKPPAVPTGDPKRDVGAAQQRLQEALRLPLTSTPWLRWLAEKAQGVTVPAEPRFYIADFYVSPLPKGVKSYMETANGKWEPITLGRLEEKLVFKINEADAWLSVQ